jgi:hypothetical protein
MSGLTTVNSKKRKQVDSPMMEDTEEEEATTIASLKATVDKLERYLLETKIDFQKQMLEMKAIVESLKAKNASNQNKDGTEASKTTPGNQVVAVAALGVAANQTSEEEEKEEKEDDGDDDDPSDVDTNDPWMMNYNKLRKYRIANGDCNVSRAKNPQLGGWVKNQRMLFTYIKQGRKGRKISPERIELLDRIGMFWGKAYPSPKTWDEYLQELKDYKEAMGDCNIKMGNKKDPSPLAKWVSYQRLEYKRFRNGRDSLLTTEQIKQLNELGFVWKG